MCRVPIPAGYATDEREVNEVKVRSYSKLVVNILKTHSVFPEDAGPAQAREGDRYVRVRLSSQQPVAGECLQLLTMSPNATAHTSQQGAAVPGPFRPVGYVMKLCWRSSEPVNRIRHAEGSVLAHEADMQIDGRGAGASDRILQSCGRSDILCPYTTHLLPCLMSDRANKRG